MWELEFESVEEEVWAPNALLQELFNEDGCERKKFRNGFTPSVQTSSPHSPGRTGRGPEGPSKCLD